MGVLVEAQSVSEVLAGAWRKGVERCEVLTSSGGSDGHGVPFGVLYIPAMMVLASAAAS
jgi:hypothetical protein